MPFRDAVLLIAVLGCITRGIAQTPTPISVPGMDQTEALQRAIDSLPLNGILDCTGQKFLTASLFLKSNITIQNCAFETMPGAVDLVAPVTVDGRNTGKSNIVLKNIHVNGNRHGQTNIGYSGEEDGGRHCFRLLGRVSNLMMEDSSGMNCAGDGIAMVSYGASISDSDLPFQHITIRNSNFSSNRRQGASADGVSDLNFDNVTFTDNGTTQVGGGEGDQCASSGGSCYGTGFWYEDYRPALAGEGMTGILFSKCVFRGNYQRSIFFFARGLATAAGSLPRGPVTVLNSYLDSGIQPLAEDYAIQFQVDEPLVGQRAAFQKILVQNSVLNGSVGFRQVSNVLLNSSRIQTSIAYSGYSAYTSGITFQDVEAFGKNFAASPLPGGEGSPLVTYSGTQGTQSYASGPPQTGTSVKGDVTWNIQLADGPKGWVCLAGGSPCQQWQAF